METESRCWKGCYAGGIRDIGPFFQPLKYELENLSVIYQFLYLPDSTKKDPLDFCKKKRTTDSLGWFTEWIYKKCTNIYDSMYAYITYDS